MEEYREHRKSYLKDVNSNKNFRNNYNNKSLSWKVSEKDSQKNLYGVLNKGKNKENIMSITPVKIQ